MCEEWDSSTHKRDLVRSGGDAAPIFFLPKNNFCATELKRGK